MASNQRDPHREQFWREVLKKHAASGLNIREFCLREQLAETSFYTWRRTIAARDSETNSQLARNDETKSPHFRDSETHPESARHKRAKQPAFVPLVLDRKRDSESHLHSARSHETKPLHIRDGETNLLSVRDSEIVIELSGGRLLRFSESISATKLAEIVHALEVKGLEAELNR